MTEQLIKVPDIGGAEGAEVVEVLVAVGDDIALAPVSYSHLTLPTKRIV